jgi:hypothetical protein
MMKQLPDMFAVTCTRDCWFAVSRVDQTIQHQRIPSADVVVLVANGPSIQPGVHLVTGFDRSM